MQIFGQFKSHLDIIFDDVVFGNFFYGELWPSRVKHRQGQPHLERYFSVFGVFDGFGVIVFHSQIVVDRAGRWVAP